MKAFPSVQMHAGKWTLWNLEVAWWSMQAEAEVVEALLLMGQLERERQNLMDVLHAVKEEVFWTARQ